MRWQEYPGLATWAQCAYKKWQREVEESKRDVTVEDGHRDDTVLSLKTDKGGHEPRNADSLFETEKGTENGSPVEPPERKAALLPP